MLWRVLQISVFLAVVFSDIHYDWAHGTSKLAVAVVAGLASLLATVIVMHIITVSAWLKKVLLARRQQRSSDRRLSGR
jgi:hypothetical protein